MDEIIDKLLLILTGTGGASVITLIITLATIFFVYSLLRYVLSTEAEQRKNLASSIFWGLIFLLVMVSVWGLVRLVKNTLDIQNDSIGSKQTQSVRSLTNF